MNFIRGHLIIQIKESIKALKASMRFTNFVCFETPVKNGEYFIDRINEHYPFYVENYACAEWKDIKGEALVEIHSLLKQNKFYVYKKIDGKNYKIRKKC